MKYFIYRFSPASIGIQAQKNLSIVCPNKQKENYLTLGFSKNQIFGIDDFSQLNLLLFFNNIQNIEDIFTLDEGLMHIVGVLKSFFTLEKEAWKISYAYKDKKFMREQLDGRVNQPQLLDPNAPLPSTFLIKPRCGASGKDIHIVSKIPEYYRSEDFLLETRKDFDTMFTCDGIAVNGKIQFFFTHEYVGNILDVKTTFINIIRTNSRYNDSIFIQRLQAETQKVLDCLGTEKIHPFHAEFFYNSTKDELSFCEIGKRFGGGNIPLLIKSAFHFDILDTYWKLINSIPIQKIVSKYPSKIAVTIAIFQNKHHQLPPQLPVPFEFFREYPENIGFAAQSLDDLRYLISCSTKDEKEFTIVNNLLKGYTNEQRT